MNVFMPHLSVRDSVEALDDKRLLKQILECKQLMNAINAIKAGRKGVGYMHHPVTKYYEQHTSFLISYAFEACLEYKHRFNKEHSYHRYFADLYELTGMPYEAFRPLSIFYHSGSLERVYDVVDSIKLFQKKLCRKWRNDIAISRKPKWTNRHIPEFFKIYLLEIEHEVENSNGDNYYVAQYIKTIKENYNG